MGNSDLCGCIQEVIEGLFSENIPMLWYKSSQVLIKHFCLEICLKCTLYYSYKALQLCSIVLIFLADTLQEWYLNIHQFRRISIEA